MFYSKEIVRMKSNNFSVPLLFLHSRYNLFRISIVDYFRLAKSKIKISSRECHFSLRFFFPCWFYSQLRFQHFIACLSNDLRKTSNLFKATYFSDLEARRGKQVENSKSKYFGQAYYKLEDDLFYPSIIYNKLQSLCNSKVTFNFFHVFFFFLFKLPTILINTEVNYFFTCWRKQLQ